jgi:hypothetical protein
MNSIASGNGVLVAVGQGGSMSSSDGIAWKGDTSTPFSANVGTNALFANSSFYACSAASGLVYARDSAAVGASTWTALNATPLVSPEAIAYGSSRFAVAQSNGSIYYSSSGATWTAATIASAPAGLSLNGLAFINNGFVAVGQSGLSAAASCILTSADGITWAVAYSGAAGTNLYGVCYGPGGYVAVGTGGSGGITVSSGSGASWTTGYGGNYSLYGIAYQNNEYVAVGNGGIVFSSPDTQTWNSQFWNTTLSESFKGVASFGASGTIFVIAQYWNS